MTDDNLIAAAIADQARGWHLFAVNGKRPAVPRWSKDSTTDPQTITAQLAGTSHGYAVDLGKSGLVVIDVDHLQHLDIPDELLTGAWCYQGQRHRISFMFSTNGHPIPQAAHPWGEVKSAGGYCVMPPSPHPDLEDGETYRWLDRDGDAPPTMPAELEALIAPRRATTPTPAPPVDVTDAHRQAAARILNRQCDEVAGTGTGNRNRSLNNAALITGHYVPHLIDHDTAVRALLDAADKCGLTGDDGTRATLSTIRSGLTAGMREPQLPDTPAAPTLLVDLVDPHDIEDAVFAYTDVLDFIRQGARARLMSPWAVLGHILATVVAETPPHYALPPAIGGEASLNLAIALVATSGGGKSASRGCARDLLTVTNPVARHIGPGTGEGIMMTFLRRRSDSSNQLVLIDHPNALLWADEIAQLDAVSARNGSTLNSLLRSMITGGDVSNTNATELLRRHLPAGTYRLAVVAGVQPALSGILLHDSDAGTPQRWLWLPAKDRHMPEGPEPDWPGTFHWTVPRPPHTRWGDRIHLTYPDHIRAELREAHRRRQRSDDEQLDLNGHRMATQLRVAAALALLHGRLDVTADDWEIAAIILEVSDAERSRCLATLAEAEADNDRRRGRSDARRRMAEAEALTGHAEKDARSAAAVVTRHAAGHGGNRHRGDYTGCPDGCITRGVQRLRGDHHRLEAAIRYAVDADWITVRDGRHWPGEVTP